MNYAIKTIAPIIASILLLYGFAQYYRAAELPMGYNELFAGSGECVQCHNTQTNQQGVSVSIVADWRSSMMANAARDPFWRAKISHEVLVNPGLQEAIEDKCTICHAPLGNFNAHYLGQDHYSIAEMEADPLALDGVQCTVCHQIKAGSLGNFSGNLDIGDQKITWGPYEAPFTMPMFNLTGYTPEYGPQINNSKLCGSCHTLLTHSVDLNGQLTDNEFVEQAVYQEWSNSAYPEMELSCQSCHVPRIADSVQVSSMPFWLEPRSPFGMHHFAGANVFILNMLRAKGEELGVTATDVQFDSTIVRAARMLQDRSVAINLSEEARTDDTLFVDLQLNNIAGHKLPSAYPSRRVFIALYVTTQAGDTIFHSGRMDGQFRLIQEDIPYELHHDVIVDEGQVMLYEMVMGDVTGELTTVLLRADHQLKDNRLPPVGFTDQHNSYDTVKIVGTALSDPDFNKVNGTQGSGSDIVHYHIPLAGQSGPLNISAAVYYQTVSFRWLEEMFTYSSTEIDRFKSYYEEADLEPLLIAAESIQSIVIGLSENEPKVQLRIYPNPAQDIVNCQLPVPSTSTKLGINSAEGSIVNFPFCTVGIYDIHGKLVEVLFEGKKSHQRLTFDVSDLPSGLYIVRLQAGSEVVMKKLTVIH